MVYGHRIKEKKEIEDFIAIIKRYGKDQIQTTSHTFFHFSKKQKEIFSESWIKEIIFDEKPFLVGIQYNKNWAVFYEYKEDVLKVVLDIIMDKIYIVTFYVIDKSQIPEI